jgi:hypothetical protein
LYLKLLSFLFHLPPHDTGEMVTTDRWSSPVRSPGRDRAHRASESILSGLMARNRRSRRNRGGGAGTLPGPSNFIEPVQAKDGDALYAKVQKPNGVPAQVTPTHYSVSLKGSPGQMLLHGSRCANTWTTGKVPAGDWKDLVIKVSSNETLAMTSTIWYSTQ